MSTTAITGTGEMMVPTSGAIKSTQTHYDSAEMCPETFGKGQHQHKLVAC